MVQICSYKGKAKNLAKCIFPKTEKVQNMYILNREKPSTGQNLF